MPLSFLVDLVERVVRQRLVAVGRHERVERTRRCVVTEEVPAYANVMALGDVAARQITASAQTDLFTYSGSSGDIIALTVVETTSWGGSGEVYDPQVTVFDPSGGVVTVFEAHDRRVITLPADGTYVFRVSANVLFATGSYALGLEGLTPATPATPTMALGDLITGQIAVPAGVDLYSYTGTSGDVIALTLVETTSWGGSGETYDPQVTVFDPSGTAVEVFEAHDRRVITLPADGTYLFRVSANVLFATGSYALGLEGLTPATPATPTMVLGDLVTGQIAAPAGVDLYSFTGSSGDVIALTVVETTSWGGSGETYDPQVTVFDPSGTALTVFEAHDRRVITLPANGTYIFRISANVLFATGSYALGLEGLSPTTPATPTMALGDLVTGQIAAAAGVDLYSYAGSAGDVIALTVVETTSWGGSGETYDPQVTVFDASGTALTVFEAHDRREITLPADGTYVFRLSANVLFATGSYALGLEGIAPPSPSPTLIACGETLPGSIVASAESDIWTVVATAGQTLTLTMTETPDWGGSNAAQATLFTPAGLSLGLVNSDGAADFTAPVAGTYVIRVSANNLWSTGAYTLGVTCS